MTDRYITFDFETVDPYLDRKLGSGWVYGMKVPDSDFETIGCSIKYMDGRTDYYPDCHEPKFLREHILIAHNVSYDLGCATYNRWDIKDVPLYDTEVMARCYDSSLMSYSLDNLAEMYLGKRKDNKALVDAIKKHDLYPWFEYEYKKSTKKGVVTKSKPEVRDWSRHDEAKIIKWSKSNMKLIQEADLDAMAQYANTDVDVTWELFNFFKDKMSLEQLQIAHKLSNTTHILADYRQRGVCVDLDAIREAQRDIGPLIEDRKAEIYKEAGRPFNLNASQDKGTILAERGLDVPRQDKKPSDYSVTSKWMGGQDDKLCALMIDYGKYNKIKRDTFDKILEIQRYTVGPDAYKGTRGRIYPELNLLRAKTGRFSSQGPNIQNIPKRHKVLGPMCRSFFVAEEGETFYSLDYSNQEGRLQVHYGVLLDCWGAEQIQKEFLRDPRFDLHQWVAELCGMDRFDGKTINLGISYGMALNTLGQALGVSRAEARALKKKYNLKIPYLQELSKKCQDTISQLGRIKTLGGRLLKHEPGFEYKALNKLIQGSASDQTLEAMILAYERGLPVIFPVHDELCMSSANKQDAYDLQALMVNAVELVVPTVVDIGEGKSWKECGEDG